MKRVNPKRKRERFAQNFGSPARVQAIKEMACCICGISPEAAARKGWDIHNSHVVARGMGGTNSDYRQVVPKCERCHDKYHAMGGTAEAAMERWGIDLEKVAARVAERLDRRGL